MAKKPKPEACDLCGDNASPLMLHARCHFTAPLQAELDADNILTLRCYVPECARVVTRFRITEIL